jgi:hypothetical protein
MPKKKEQEKEDKQKQILETEQTRYNVAKTNARRLEQLTSDEIEIPLSIG